MRLGRAQAVIIRENKVLFGYGKVGERLGHFFIGGGVEIGETSTESVLREVREELNVKGKIIFKLRKEVLDEHFTFLIDICNQECTLGYDPEEDGWEEDKLSLQKLIWVPLNEKERFTSIDIAYFMELIEECNERMFNPEWLMEMKQLV